MLDIVESACFVVLGVVVLADLVVNFLLYRYLKRLRIALEEYVSALEEKK